MKVLITGDSHTGALQRGKESLINKGKWPQEIDLTVQPFGPGGKFSTPFFVDRGSYAEICNPIYRKQFKYFPPLELENTDVIYGLSNFFHPTGTPRTHKDWMQFAPSSIVINEAPVSNILLNRVALDICLYLLKFVDIILRNQKKIFVIEAPKPFRHNVKLIRPDVYIYSDNYYRNFIIHELKLRNVPVITVDSKCCDNEGFMLNQYRHENQKDMTHANAEFGELMMEKILNFLLE